MLSRLYLSSPRRRMPLWLVAGAVLLFGIPAFADTVKDHFDKGIALYKDKKLDDALAEFALARKALAPKEDATILYWIGFINLQEQKYAEALEPLEQAVKLNTKVADAHLNLGNVYDGLHRYEDAAHEFEAATELQPRSADAFYNLGSVYYKLKRLPDSIAAYKRAAANNPSDPFIQDGLGFVLQASGNLPAAIAAYQKATKLGSDNSNFWLNLGLASLSQARSVQPGGVTGTTKEDPAWADARNALDRAAQLAPTNYAIREAYAESLFETGKDADAVTQFEKASQLDPKQFVPFYNLGLVQAKLGHVPAAVDAFRKALAIKPDNADVLQGLGLAQFKMRAFDDAAQTFKKLTELTPDDLRGWINLSSSLKSKGDGAGAVAVLEEATKHGKGARLGLVRRALAGNYYRKGDAANLARAQEQFTRSLQDAPDNAEAYNGLGLIAQKQNKVDDALSNFKRAVALNPRYADALNNLGVAYEAKGEQDLAIKKYQEALRIDPNHVLAKKNLARFDKIKKG